MKKSYLFILILSIFIVSCASKKDPTETIPENDISVQPIIEETSSSSELSPNGELFQDEDFSQTGDYSHSDFSQTGDYSQTEDFAMPSFSEPDYVEFIAIPKEDIFEQKDAITANSDITSLIAANIIDDDALEAETLAGEMLATDDVLEAESLAGEMLATDDALEAESLAGEMLATDDALEAESLAGEMLATDDALDNAELLSKENLADSNSLSTDARNADNVSTDARNADNASTDARNADKAKPDARNADTTRTNAELANSDKNANSNKNVNSDKNATADNSTQKETPQIEDVIFSEEDTAEPELIYEQTSKTYSFTTPAEYRKKSLKKNQYLVIEYPGTNWLFLGDEYNSECTSFSSREFSDDSTIFTVRTTTTGEAFLHFTKYDSLTKNNIDDYILVNVSNSFGNFEKIKMDNYDYSEPEMTEIDEEHDFTNYYGPSIEDEPEILLFEDNFFAEDSSLLSEEELLGNAQKYFDTGKFELALDEINTLQENYPQNDYNLFMQAQILEAKSPIQDIKKAVSLYKQIVSDYPESKYWQASKQRQIYLERFYLNIR